MMWLSVKVTWVLLHEFLMGTPRLGDDSLIYLWTAANNALMGRSSSPAIASITELYRGLPPQSGLAHYNSERVVMTAIGSDFSPVSVILGLALKLGLSLKAASILMEGLTLAVLTTGISMLLSRLYGYASAGLSLAFLAIVLLPGQGLHNLVPGVLVLGVGLILFRLSLSSAPNIWAAATLSCLAVATHQIALAYIGIAALFHVSLHLLLKDKLSIRYIVSLMVGAAIAMLSRYLPGFAPEIAIDVAGRLSLLSLPANVGAFASIIIEKLRYSSIAEMLGWLVIAWAAIKWFAGSPAERDRASLLALLIALALLAGFIYDLPVAYGELAARLIVPLAIVVTGAGCCHLLSVSALLGKPERVAVGGIAVALIASLPNAVTVLFDKVNDRWPIITGELERQINEINTPASFTYTEANYAMLAAFLAGADRFQSLPYALLGGNDPSRGIGTLQPATHLVAMPPKALNSLAEIRSWSWRKRFFGFSLDEFKSVTIKSSEFKGGLHLKLAGITAKLIVVGTLTGGETCATEVPDTVGEGWRRIDLAECRGKLDAITIRGERVDLVGLSLGEPKPNLNWPWGRPVVVSAARSSPSQPLSIDFSWNGILQANRSAELGPTIGSRLLAISDAGGVIIAGIEAK